MEQNAFEEESFESSIMTSQTSSLNQQSSSNDTEMSSSSEPSSSQTETSQSQSSSSTLTPHFTSAERAYIYERAFQEYQNYRQAEASVYQYIHSSEPSSS